MSENAFRWELVPYTRGRVIQIGAGPDKAFPHFKGVDEGPWEKMGYKVNPDLQMPPDRLEFIASQSCDAVVSTADADVAACAREWWRVLKPGGHLCLHTTSSEQYVIDALDFAGYDMVESRTLDNKLFCVLRKAKGKSYSCRSPRPTKTALVCRFGAFGDLMQASSVFSGLKSQGFHVTLICSPPGVDVVLYDPHIDRFIITDKDQIPNAALGEYWEYLSGTVDRFVNLSESVEGTWLALPGRAQHAWPDVVRRQRLAYNYLQFQHELAGVPHNPAVRFYPTTEERAWARTQRERMGSRVVMWSLSGSSVHKVNPHVDAIIARFMVGDPDTHVVIVGGPECRILEAGWQDERRVHCTSGVWSIRQSLAFLEQCDLVIGPETGVLNAASCMDLPKIVFLSHSSEENLTRDWKNCIALQPDAASAPCYPCNRLHYGWKFCHEDKATGTALCQVHITPDMIWDAACKLLKLKQEKAA